MGLATLYTMHDAGGIVPANLPSSPLIFPKPVYTGQT